jgi:ATP/maltotriose-dependent transcriptional regulator MalT
MGRLLVLIDAFESATPLETWLRERFIQRLPSRSMVVIAGRVPPSQEWVAGMGWRDLLRVVSLRNLSPDEVRGYLELQGIDEVFQDRVLTLTHGHPLALSLVIDVLDQRARRVGGITDLGDAPDVVRMLMERFIDEIPDRRHREALAVCAHARFTTEDLLRAAMGGDDAQDLLAWLRSRSFVEEGRDGVFPHDLARDVLDTVCGGVTASRTRISTGVSVRTSCDRSRRRAGWTHSGRWPTSCTCTGSTL